MSNFDIDLVIGRLLMDLPVWASVSRNMIKVETKAIPTAGVRINEQAQWELLYNRSFMEMLHADINNPENDDRFTLLKHEFYHIVLGHLVERSDIDAGKNPRMKNVAFDLAINSHLTEIKRFAERYAVNKKNEWMKIPQGKNEKLPEGFQPFVPCVPNWQTVLPDGKPYPYAKFPPLLSGERYYDLLMQQQEQQQKDKGQGQPPQGGEGEGDPSDGMIDDHGEWGDVPEDIKQIARERMREALRDGVEEANKTGKWGNTPNEIREQVIKFVKGTLDWRKVLRYFIQSSVKADKTNSIKKINRRFPYIHAGRKSNRTANIAISIDQSGSVGDDMLEAFFSELNNLASMATFTVIPFDCHVVESKIEVWKKGQKQKAKRVLSGGTDFNAPTKWVNDAGTFDGHIVLTDMQADKPIPSRCQRMWLTTEDCMRHIPFTTNERVIPITNNKR